MTSNDSKVGTVAKIYRNAGAVFEAGIERWLNQHVAGLQGTRIASLQAPASGGLSGETYIVSLSATNGGVTSAGEPFAHHISEVRCDGPSRLTTPSVSSFSRTVTSARYSDGLYVRPG